MVSWQRGVAMRRGGLHDDDLRRLKCVCVCVQSGPRSAASREGVALVLVRSASQPTVGDVGSCGARPEALNVEQRTLRWSSQRSPRCGARAQAPKRSRPPASAPEAAARVNPSAELGDGMPISPLPLSLPHPASVPLPLLPCCACAGHPHLPPHPLPSSPSAVCPGPTGRWSERGAVGTPSAHRQRESHHVLGSNGRYWGRCCRLGRISAWAGIAASCGSCWGERPLIV